MSIADTIKQGRERLGMTQEDLAEKLEVSRQAVSKWELGASVPSPENLGLLEEVLDIDFPSPEGTVPPATPKAAVWNRKRIVLLALGALVLSALLSIGMYVALVRARPTDVPRPADAYLTGISFFDENAAPLQPDLGDGWFHFAPDSRVLMVVEFGDGSERTADGVSLFLTPTGTETYDQREQLAVQAVYDGRHFALFALDIPQGLMRHLDIVLESGGVQTVAETLNVTAPSVPSEEEGFDVLTIPTGLDLELGGPYTILHAMGVSDTEIVWSSSNPGVAVVTDIGAVLPVSSGDAVITAEWNGQTAECRVHVFDTDHPVSASEAE